MSDDTVRCRSCSCNRHGAGRSVGAHGPVDSESVMDWLTSAEFRTWVTASCVRQGVPVTVTDVLVVSEVAVLLSGGTARREAKRRRPGRPGSETPDEVHPGVVEFPGTGDVGGDDGVVEHGSHDGVLAGQVEIGPLSA